MFITGSIHAREYAPAELVTRFAEYLVDGYGVDADATWMVDYHEIHLMLMANPDARKKAEAGLFLAQERQRGLLLADERRPGRRPQPQLQLRVGLLQRLERQRVLADLPRAVSVLRPGVRRRAGPHAGRAPRSETGAARRTGTR